MTIAAPAFSSEIAASADGFAGYLQARALLDEVSLHRALAAQGKSGERLTVVLTRLGLMAETDLARALADHLSLGIAERKDIPEESVLTDRLQPDFLRSKQVLPLSFSDGRLALAMVDPTDEEVCRAAEYHLDCRIDRLVIAPADFSWGWERLYGASDQKPALPHSGDDLANLDVARLKELASEAPTIRLVNQLFNEAVEAGASDIHIEPFEASLLVRFRIDGRLHQVRALPISQAAAIVSRVKIIAGLDISERRLPQDGRVRTSVRGMEIDLRVSCIPNLHGEGLVIRLLDRRGLDLSLPALGLPQKTSKAVQSILQEPSGIVLVTGPTGSGKTTTLYAMLSLLNEPRRKIITVEDPVEYRFAGINQIQVHPAIGLDFAASLRAILRHDPDVVMVGEIRDSETARIAVQASLTGHLVLSTVHTNSAAATLTRLMDMGVEDYLLASTLKGVLAQRLVRKLCSHCAEAADAHEQFRALAEQVSLKFGQEMLKKPVGCSDCRGTGFSGRTTVSEFLRITPAIREHIRSRAPEGAVTHDAVAGGMHTLLADGLRLVAEGTTTIAEVLEVVGVS